jgi:predicted peptidase
MFLSRTVIAALFSLTSAALADGSGSQTFSGEVTLKVGYHYLLSLPEGYEADTAKKWPLLVFLHGSGERGDNLELLNKHGPPKLIAAGKKFEAIVVSPQVPDKNIWNAHGVKALIDDLAKKQRVDTSRIYLFHGDKDGAVSVDFSIRMHNALQKAGSQARLTIYPGVGHDSWTQSYDNPELWTWLFAQKRS